MKQYELSDKMKKDIINQINEIEIDVSNLSSYNYHPAVSSEHAFSSDSWEDWDEEEEFQVKKNLFYSWVLRDGISCYIDCPDDRNLDKSALLFIENLEREDCYE